MFVPTEGRARFSDGPFNGVALPGPAYAGKVLMATFPKGGSYTVEETADGVFIYRDAGPTTRTGDAGPVTPADINRMQAAYWAKRRGG